MADFSTDLSLMTGKVIKKDFEEMDFPTLMSELEDEEREEQEQKRIEQEKIEENKSKKTIQNRFSSSVGNEFGELNVVSRVGEYGNVSRRLSLPCMREREREISNGNDNDPKIENEEFKDRRSLNGNDNDPKI